MAVTCGVNSAVEKTFALRGAELSVHGEPHLAVLARAGSGVEDFVADDREGLLGVEGLCLVGVRRAVDGGPGRVREPGLDRRRDQGHQRVLLEAPQLHRVRVVLGRDLGGGVPHEEAQRLRAHIIDIRRDAGPERERVRALVRLDRFVDAMVAIRAEIARVESGEWPQDNNPLKHAPHTQSLVVADDWNRPYGRQQAAFPLDYVRNNKFWPSVARVNNTVGDRNLICTCEPTEAYMEAEA